MIAANVDPRFRKNKMKFKIGINSFYSTELLGKGHRLQAMTMDKDTIILWRVPVFHINFNMY